MLPFQACGLSLLPVSLLRSADLLSQPPQLCAKFKDSAYKHPFAMFVLPNRCTGTLFLLEYLYQRGSINLRVAMDYSMKSSPINSTLAV